MARSSRARSTWAGSPSSARLTWTPHWNGAGRSPRSPPCPARCGRCGTATEAEAPVPVPGPDIERVFREEYGRAVSVLVRVFGDIDIAEDAVQDAFARAVVRWPEDGLPPSPAGWIITT